MKKASTKVLSIFIIMFMTSSLSNAGGTGKSSIKLGTWFSGLFKSTDDVADGAGDTARRVTPPPVSVSPDGTNTPSNTPLTLESITEVIQPQANIKGIQMIARRLSDIMMRQVKSAAILVAPAGSGKTALSRGIVYLINQQERVVRNLHGYTTLRVDWMEITKGTGLRGSLEQKLVELKQVIADSKDKKIILVFDELEEILRDENGLKFLTSLKTEFSEETGVKFIFNITPGPMNELMKDPQLIRRLYKLMGEVPSDEVVMEILRHMKKQAFEDHGIVISQKHLDYIMEISKKHPELGNPDGAITLLDDARIMASSDMLKGDVRVDELIKEIEQHRTIIDGILSSREEGDPQYFGAYYDELLEVKESKVIEAENYIEEFKNVYEATDEKRLQLLAKIEERAALYRKASSNLAEDADGNKADPEIIIDRLTKEIADLQNQISESSTLLQGGDLKDIHIVRTGMTYLNKSEAEVAQIIYGTPSVAAVANRIQEKVNQSYEAVFAVTNRIIRKRKFHNDEKALGLLLVSGESTKDSDAFVRTMADEITGRPPHKINGSSVRKEDQVNTQMGVKEGYAGYNENIESGYLFKQQKLSNGNYVVHIKDPEVTDAGFQDEVTSIIIDGKANSNVGREADFTETIFAMTMKGVEPLTDAQKTHLAGLPTDLQRQEYLRGVVKRKFRRERGVELSDSLLEELYIVFTHVDDAPVSNLKVLVAEKIRSTTLKNFFSDKFKISMNFSDEYVDYLFNLVKELGASKIDDLIEMDVEPQIHALQESFTIISGDNIMMDIAEDGSVIAHVEKWSNEASRELALAAAREADSLSSGAKEATDEIDVIKNGLGDI